MNDGYALEEKLHVVCTTDCFLIQVHVVHSIFTSGTLSKHHVWLRKTWCVTEREQLYNSCELSGCIAILGIMACVKGTLPVMC